MGVIPSISGQALVDVPLQTKLASGVAAIGTNWHIAYFNKFHVEASRPVKRDSWILDVVPGNQQASISGFAGMVLDLTNATAALSISQLGRFHLGGRRSHKMTVINASTGPNSNISLIPWFRLPQVDLAACEADLLGFCYTPPMSPPLLLAPGTRYYVVSEEDESDPVTEMTDP